MNLNILRFVFAFILFVTLPLSVIATPLQAESGVAADSESLVLPMGVGQEGGG